MTAADLARVDVPAAEVAADVKAAAAKQAELLEQRHQFLDLDADSQFTVPGCICPACPPREGAAS